jgi:chemotaxis protein CheD
MSKVIDISVGEMAVGVKDVQIKTSGIGSCVVVCLYDEEARAGGMIHSMLPTKGAVAQKDKSAKAISNSSVAKYVDEGIERLVFEVEQIGAVKDRLVAKLAGGSKMFKFIGDEKNSIGLKNLEMAKQELIKHGIPVSGEDTGGTVGRVAEFDLENGILNIEIKI